MGLKLPGEGYQDGITAAVGKRCSFRNGWGLVIGRLPVFLRPPADKCQYLITLHSFASAGVIKEVLDLYWPANP